VVDKVNWEVFLRRHSTTSVPCSFIHVSLALCNLNNWEHCCNWTI
jgi:hypothetical protein